MFLAYSGILTKVHILKHICPYWDSVIIRILPLQVQIMKSNTCSSNQVILLNHFSDLFGTFFHCFKLNKTMFFLQGPISIITLTVKLTYHPGYNATHAFQASTLPTQADHSQHPRKNSALKVTYIFKFFRAQIYLRIQ